jgi:hypothetical protein
MPINDSYPPFDLRHYGAVANDSAAAGANVTAFADWKAACDAANVEAEGLIPEGTYYINAAVALPKKVHSYGSIAGEFVVGYGPAQFGYIEGNLTCRQFKVSGAYFCNLSNVRADTSIVVDGGGATNGTFWNRFTNWNTPSLTITIANFSVNQNYFSGLIRYIHLTGARVSGSEAHANVFDVVDASNNALPNFGILQDDGAMQVNFVRGLYMENGSQIEGNFHLIGQHGDLGQPPLVDDLKHVLFSTQHSEKNCKDFLSLTTFNLARGGSWDWLDINGKPPCLSQSGGASVSVQSDSTGPHGITKRYEATFADPFDNFQITIQPSNLDRIGIVIFYKSTVEFAAVTLNDGAGDISLGTRAVRVNRSGSDDGWRMLRLTGRANKTGNTTLTLFGYAATGGAAKTMSIGGIFAGSEAAVLYPAKNDSFFTNEPVDGTYSLGLNGVSIQSGQKDQATTTSTPVNISFTYPQAFANNPNITFNFLQTATSTHVQNMTKAYLTAISTTGATVRVEFAGSFDGRLYWTAIGRRA